MSAEPVPALPIVAMGVSATGKTSVAAEMAEQLGIEFIEGDEFHPQANIEKMAEGIPLDDADRRPWLETLAEVIAERQRRGTPVIVTCSALKRSYRDLLRAGATDIFFVHLDADFDVLMDRMAQRTKHFMPASLLQSQFDTLERLQDDETGAVIDVEPPLETVVAEAIKAVHAHARGDMLGG